ncbi:MAG: NAD(P)H-dependent flavin oxidoreductase [Thermodesulfobacteriota bacterium]
MKTRVTELFGIRYPILLSGMTGISNPRLTAAVSNAGGLGILATADIVPDRLRRAVQEVRGLTDKPFGANVPFLLPGSAEKAAVLVAEKVPVINYTLGKGQGLIDAVHEYGGRVIATVTLKKHALSAEKSGADAVIVTGHEAAAHGGEATSLVLIPHIADALAIPVVAAGGFSDGRGLAAALALGAEGIAMGTRFMNTLESPAHANMKQMSNTKGVQDTVYSDRIDGLPCRALKTNGTRRLMNQRLYMISALVNSRNAARAFGFPWFKMFLGILLSGYRRSRQLARMANAFQPIQRAIETGDLEKGVFLMGQVTGNIRHTPAVAELMETIIREALTARMMVAEKLVL